MDDEKILARAQEIKAERGISLTDAMIAAEDESRPRPEIQTEFEVTISVKPRVARWIAQEFANTATHTLEERLGAYLSTVLANSRVSARKASAEYPDVTKGRAVSVPRHLFQSKAGTE